MENDGRWVDADQFADNTWLDVQAMISRLREDMTTAAARVGPGNPGLQAYHLAICSRLDSLQERIRQGESIYYQKIRTRLTAGRTQERGE